MGLCVLVFDSSGELVNGPEETVCGVPCSSRTEFVMGRSTSKEEAFGTSTGAPMEIPSSFSISVFCFGKLGIIWFRFPFPGAASDGPCFSRAGDVSTETEVRHKRKRRQAVITRRLVPLSGQEPSPVEFGSRERSRELLEQAFDDANGEFKMRIL